MNPTTASAIVADYKAGVKMRVIAERHGVTRSEVNQALYNASELGKVYPKARGIVTPD